MLLDEAMLERINNGPPHHSPPAFLDINIGWDEQSSYDSILCAFTFTS